MNETRRASPSDPPACFEMTTRPLPSTPSRHHLLPLSSLLLLLLLLLLLFLYFHRRRRASPSAVPRLPFHLLAASFRPSLSLGRGASSSVFLATLPSLSPAAPVAVKLFRHHADPSFLNELRLLSLIPRSPFVVSLLASSSSARRDRSLLVFEYLPNRSLQDALFSPGLLLRWPCRFRILLDVAEALSFLHARCDPPVVHSDVKPSNVLLDADFRAKLSDFGLAAVKSSPAATPDVGSTRDDQSESVSDVGPSPASDDHCRWKQDVSGVVDREWLSRKRRSEETSVVADVCCDVKRKRKIREWWKEEQQVPEVGKARKVARRRGGEERRTAASMRGTVCYVAPECAARGGLCGQHAEKADVYSFGVLMLVVVSGRRPLHVLASPMKLEKANLIGWCRQLAQGGGDVLELVDERLEGDYDQTQVRMCVDLALLCLQRAPERRPNSVEVVKILKGEAALPPLPAELTVSPAGPRRKPKKRRQDDSGGRRP